MSDLEYDEQVDINLLEQNERFVLGAVMSSPTALQEVQGILTRDDFYAPKHAVIWDAITAVAESDPSGKIPLTDPVLVANRMQEDGTLGQVGGGMFLLNLHGGNQNTSNAGYYARKVAKAARMRRGAEIGATLMQGFSSDLSAEDQAALVANAMDGLEDVASGGRSEEAAEQIGTGFEDFLDVLEKGGIGEGITTGLHDLDEILVGMLPGQMITVGARPGVGKTVAALHLAVAAASQGRTSLMFTLEMDRQEMLGRLLAQTCQINSRHLNRAAPKLTDDDWDRLAKGMQKVMALPLLVCDDSGVTPSKINALIGAYKRRHPDLGLVVIDYAQLMSGDGRAESRQQEISQISRALKLAAKRHKVTVVLLSQLNRKSEERTDKRPQSSDLRESGSLEQDSDVIILLHREDLYEPESPRAGEMDLIVTKNRNGATGTAVAVAQMHYYRLSSMAHGGSDSSGY